MATLDDKLLGEKLHYYCSSSEDEEDGGVQPPPGPASSAAVRPRDGGSANTGPKGVLKDWQRFKQLESERREEAELERLALAKKLSLSCQTEREEAAERERELELELEMESLLEDEFMKDYMAKRMQEMMNITRSDKRFGEMIHLLNGEDFLTAVDQEDKTVTVIILLQEPGVEGCAAMLGCLSCIARDYRSVKFCQIAASAAGLSRHFKVSGVPALLVYRAGTLVASFVRLTDQFGQDFFANEVEAFLLEHAMLPDKDSVPGIMKARQDSQDDSD